MSGDENGNESESNAKNISNTGMCVQLVGQYLKISMKCFVAYNLTYHSISTVSGNAFQFVFIGSKAMRKTVPIDLLYHKNCLRYSLPVQNTKSTKKILTNVQLTHNDAGYDIGSLLV